MNKIILAVLLFSFAAYSQTNRFSGTWSNENRKDASKQYVLKITLAESKHELYPNITFQSYLNVAKDEYERSLSDKLYDDLSKSKILTLFDHIFFEL
jgi:hypothetical protein